MKFWVAQRVSALRLRTTRYGLVQPRGLVPTMNEYHREWLQTRRLPNSLSTILISPPDFLRQFLHATPSTHPPCRHRPGPIRATDAALPHHRSSPRRKRRLAPDRLGLRHARRLPSHHRRPHLDPRTSSRRRIARLPRRSRLLRRRSLPHVRWSRRPIPHLPHRRPRPSPAPPIYQPHSQRPLRLHGLLGSDSRHRPRRPHPR